MPPDFESTLTQVRQAMNCKATQNVAAWIQHNTDHPFGDADERDYLQRVERNLPGFNQIVAKVVAGMRQS